MKMIIPAELSTLVHEDLNLTEVTSEASERLEAGLSSAVVMAWMEEEEGCPAPLTRWLVAFLAEHGVPESIEFEESEPQDVLPADAGSSEVTGEVVSFQWGGRPILLLDADPTTIDETQQVAPPSPPARSPIIAAPPAPTPIPSHETATNIPAELSHEVLITRISPLAEAFPSWDLLPPPTLVKRIRRSL